MRLSLRSAIATRLQYGGEVCSAGDWPLWSDIDAHHGLGRVAVGAFSQDRAARTRRERATDALPPLPRPAPQPADVAHADHGHVIEASQLGVRVAPQLAVRLAGVVVRRVHRPR